MSKPGGTGTDGRVHGVYDLGVYDLGSGGFSHLELTDKPGEEALDRGSGVEGETGVEGEIRIADRGYSAAKALRRFIAAGQTVEAHPGFRGDGTTIASTSAVSNAFPRFLALCTNWKKAR